MNQGVYSILCSSTILNGSGWYGIYNIVFVKSNGTDYLYILSGPAITGPCDVPVHELLEQGKGRRNKVGAYGGVGGFVIYVNECSPHVREDLNRILKLLANIMRFPQRCARVHDDVDLNEVIWAALSYAIL